ncbi:3382_t:CDS:2, partial [Diversispora eburnea]
MRHPNLLFLLATSTTLVNTKNVLRRFYTQSTFHSTKRFHTLSHIPPFYHVFFPWKILNNINRLAKELIQIWIERGKPNNIGFHVFSDNGIYHYALLCEAIRQLSRGSHFMSPNPSTISNSSSISDNISEEAESFLNSIKSCVIDSAPSPISEKYVALGIVVKKHQNLVHNALDNIPGGTFDGRNFKFLFLYGPGDEIIPEDEVIKFMKKLKNRDKIYSNNNNKQFSNSGEYSNNGFFNNKKNYIHKNGKSEMNEKNGEKNKGILKIMEKRFKVD